MSTLAPRRALLDRLTTRLDGIALHAEDRPEADALGLQWLGTAGFRLQCAGTHLWFDPHFSRHSLAEVAFGRLAPKVEQVRAHVDIAHGVVVGHSHFDHAIDTPILALDHGAQVYGAADTLAWCRGMGVQPAQLHLLSGDATQYPLGPFTIGARRSVHSPFALGRVPFPGHIREAIALPARASAWRVGDVLIPHVQWTAPSGRVLTLAHVGSAALVDAELHSLQADIVLACTIGRHATPRFTHRLLDALAPKLVVPCHWDQFWQPLHAPPRQIPSNDLAGFLREVASHPSAPQVQVLPPLGWTTLAPVLAAKEAP